MSRIRKLYYFDKKRTRKMISFLNNSAEDTYINHIMFNPFVPLHHLLPLSLKFIPESYVLETGKEIKGLITVAPSRCPMKKMEIQKLFFEENCLEDAAELVQYAVSKYKAMGTTSFIVRIDDYLAELANMFISKCGFSQISYEKLWKIQHIEKKDYKISGYREFRNTDSYAVASLYNESLLPHFRPLLSKDIKEFKEVPFKGLAYYTEYKYVIEDLKSRSVIAYITITTTDNSNYILEITNALWAEIDLDEVIAFANYQIHKRQKHFNLFVKTLKYTQKGEDQEREFMNRNFDCVQNQIVLTNTSAKIIRDKEPSGRFTAINQIYSGIQAAN